MKHQTVLRPNESKLPNLVPKRFFIYGSFQTEIDRDPCVAHAANLLRAQIPVYTVAGHGAAHSQHKISFATNYKYEKTSAAVFDSLKDCSDIVVYLSAVLTPIFSTLHPWRRIKERVRIGRFAQTLLHQKKPIWLVGTKAELALFKTFVQLPDTADIVSLGLASSLGIPQKDWDKIRDISGVDAASIVEQHARHAYDNGRMDAKSILMSVQNAPAKDPELALICRLSLSKRLQDHPMVKRIVTYSGPVEPIMRTDPPYPALDLAIANDSRVATSAYALHLYRLHAEDGIDSDTNAPKIARWYTNQAHKFVPSGWVPALNLASQQTLDLPELHHIDMLCAFFNGEITLDDIGGDLRTALQTTREPSGPSGLVLLIAILCRQTARDLDPNALWKDVRLTQWFDAKAAALNPMLKSVAALNLNFLAKRRSISVIGLQTGGSGLAQNMNMTCLALARMGLTYRTRDTHEFYDVKQPRQSATKVLKRNVAIHHVNAERIPMHLMSPDFAHRNDIHHIGYALWETSELPAEHDLGARMLDEIWTPSTFVTDLYKDKGVKCVTNIGKGIPQLPELTFLANTTHNDAKGMTCLTAFDFHSSVERKNPLAAVKAFQIAFPKQTHPHHRMIVKSTPAVSRHWGDPQNQTEQIDKLAQADSRIRVIKKFLSTDAYMDLLASADCILSPHRGEGFGYLAAYGLALAKPVIATNFGGTQDFCTHETSFLVRPHLTPVPDGQAIYDAVGAKWADVNPDEIAHNLHHIDVDRKHAQDRAFEGQSLIQKEYSMDALVVRYSDRLHQIGAI